ncbi:MAG: M60 family metallopeptidase [Bacteroides sp.]|nr:M60 family metallopeptidase [Bacteroides sp.]MCM1378946.1 M60 family metallopeptidase [Bacteroides sp.]MCM1445562.1 M60 family metallopeptidase [Prevotella sp.]
MKKSLYTKLFAVVVLGVSALAAQAVMPENGKVYRVINKSYGTALADRGPSGIVGCSEFNNDNMSQRWQVEVSGKSYYFKSIGTGKYLKSSRARSTGWTVSAGKNAMTVTSLNDNYVIKAAGDGDNLAAHCDAQSNVVCWNADILPSQWDFEEIAMTQAEIDAALSTLSNMEAEVAKESTYATVLDAIFADKACTTLKSGYQSMSDDAIKDDANYKALSAPLQAMVLKVKNGNWSETTSPLSDTILKDWDSEHAKKYRVQLYEPYSEGSSAAKLAEIQAYTNMNNPTGIIANTGDVLYVMVEGKIKDGATLYMGSATGYGMFNDCTSGIELHEGLNLVPIWSDMAHQFIYYTVNTADWPTGDQTRAQLKHKVTDYDDLKIHIEGGQVNGFFNRTGDELYSADTDEDFRYTSVRAQFPMYDLMGKYVILHFFLFDTKSKVDAENTSWGLLSVMDPEKNPAAADRKRSHSMTEIMRYWDEMCFRERTLMGIQSDEELAQYNHELLWDYYEPLTGDKIEKHPAGNTWNTDPGFQYSDYFNNRMMGITMQGSLFMNATSWRTAYNISTLDAILCQIPHDSGSMWGPAHEYGHMNQFPMKFAGTTEESNNIFSNVAVYYLGKNTSRSSTPLDQLKIFNQDLTYLEHSTWGTTRMFLQLWCYYHACGNNKKFYPRLYELLRNNPRQQSYYLNPRYDQCHFAKMCCIAAQEDLTDFFESWGFFVPLDNYHIGDYSNFYATLTKEDAQAVKDEIKALGLPKNDQIILIDDRPGVTDRDSWYSNDMAISRAGKFGGIADFRNKVKASGSMTCTMRNDSLVVEIPEGANPGVGFLVYHNDGTLLAFTNDVRCPLKKAATAALMTGNAKVYAVSADGSRVEVVNDYVNRPISEHLSNLRKLVESCADIANYIDPTGTKVGYYIPLFVKGFTESYNAAKNVSNNATIDDITTLYLDLLDKYNAAKTMNGGRVQMIPGSRFKIFNGRFTENVLASSGTAANCRASKEDAEQQEWIIEEVGGKYRFKNVKYQNYIGVNAEKPNQDAALPMADKASQAALFSMNEMSPGHFTFAYNGDTGYCIHTKGDSGTGLVILTDQGWEASRWTVEVLEAEPVASAQSSLRSLIEEATMAYEEAGLIAIDADPIALTEDMLSSNAKSQSGEDVFTSFDVLLDNDFQTYFHTNTNNEIDSDDGGNHYIQIDLGEGQSTTSFQISLSNRDVSRNGEDVEEDDENAVKVNNPINMNVLGSNDGSKFTRVGSLEKIPSKSGSSFASNVITDGNPYRYIRLDCVGGAGRAHNHFYFCISELGIANAQEVAKIKEQYPAVTQEMMFNMREQLEKAAKVARSTQTSATVYNNAYNSLNEVFQILAAAMGIETAIDEITLQQNPSMTVNGIYDLQGRRVLAPAKGIFIINGVKTLVK